MRLKAGDMLKSKEDRKSNYFLLGKEILPKFSFENLIMQTGQGVAFL